MNSKERSPRTFFYTVLLMGLLVLGTIVGYFLLLPRAIPKQITVAVLPFDGPAEVAPHLKIAFPRHLTELLALSRDLTIVDFDASQQAMDLDDEFRGFTHELGATHIVDGSFEQDPETAGKYFLTVRVVKVSQPAWKVRWDEKYRFSDEHLLDIRDRAILGIRKGLYDNSAGELIDESGMRDNFESYLKEQFLVESKSELDSTTIADRLMNMDGNPYAVFLAATLDPSVRSEAFERALTSNARHYPSLIEKAWDEYSESNDLHTYIETITELAGSYPNSEAIKRLASVYHALGWFEAEQELLYRWVKIRPRSGEAALAFAFSRYRTGNDAGVQEALTIASLREPLSKTVQMYRTLYDGEEMPSPWWEQEADPQLRIRLLAIQNRTSEAGEILGEIKESLSCDEELELSLYVGELDQAIDQLDCVSGFWMQPPGWWTDDDERWVAFTSDERYESWRDQRGFSNASTSQLVPASIPKLFAPVRRVLPE